MEYDFTVPFLKRTNRILLQEFRYSSTIKSFIDKTINFLYIFLLLLCDFLSIIYKFSQYIFLLNGNHMNGNHMVYTYNHIINRHIIQCTLKTFRKSFFKSLSRQNYKINLTKLSTNPLGEGLKIKIGT